ncbi:MobV family relaxase [Psychrobacter cibarius]|uniref:MobV family relaxase n=1 Tax=Psychrobacter cibarius TaxID=282669 RepID=UPI00191AD4A5|nr:MobV family relaxase [Psychrobacter cibarius]
MEYAILRTAKLKTMGNIGGSLAHNYRTIDTPNADPKRTSENEHTVATPEAVKQAIQDLLPEKRRSDAVLCVEYLITASPNWKGWGTDKEDDFFERAGQWLYDKHGKENIAAMSLHRDETTPHLVAYVVPIDQKGKLNCKEFLGGRAKLNKMQTDFANQVKDLGLTRGKEGSRSKHTSIKEYYHDINNARDFSIKAETPKPEMFESKARYGEKITAAVIEQVEPTIKAAKSILNDYERARLYKKIAEDSYDTLRERVEPYLVATEGLNKDEITRVNEAMQLESRKIAVERDESKKAMDVSKESQTANNAKRVDKWSGFYRSLSRSKQNKVTRILKELENLKNPAALDDVKTKLMNEPKIINDLPEERDHKKDPDISI